MNYKDQVVWITGASSGIGEAMAYAYYKEGANLIISARRIKELERVKSNCGDNMGEIHIIELDLADLSSHERIANEALRIYGHIDVIVNNGGISQRGLAHETEMSVVEKVMAVNFLGSVSITKQLLPSMIARKQGHIIVISSVVGKIGTRLRSTYAASKHALHGWFDSLRQEVFVHNIDVTLVCPGFVKTSVTLNALTPDGSKLNKMGEAQMKGLTTEEFINKLMPKLMKRKKEIYIGGKEILTIYLKRFVPSLLEVILRKVKTT